MINNKLYIRSLRVERVIQLFLLIIIKGLVFIMDKKHIKDFPYEIEVLDPQENRELQDYFLASKKDFVRIGPNKILLQTGFLLEMSKIYNFALRDDDIFVVTFPKSGTTMTQELIWLLRNNLDYEKAQSITLNERFPFLEVAALCGPDNIEHIEAHLLDLLKKAVCPLTINDIKEMASPRFLKTHLPLALLPPSLLDTIKVVYVARDPRDVAVSFYHHHKLMKIIKPDKDFKSFWKYFISNKIMWGPYFEHVLEAWKHRNNPNMLFLFYEDMIKNLPEAIQRVAKFLGRTLSEDEVDRLAQHLDIDNFKKNKSVNLEDLQKSGVLSSGETFIRKGKSGGWRKYFDEEMTAEADEWIATHLRDTDFRFPHY